MLFQLTAERLPVNHWEPVIHCDPVAFIVGRRILARNMSHADQTGGGSLASDHVGGHFFFEGLDEGLGRIIFEEQVEVGFVFVDEAAKGGDVDVFEVGVHDVVNG